MASRADYVCVNGFRHVVPYIHTWRTVAKGRWIGQEVLDLLSNEFARYPRAYFTAALSAGTVLLDGKQALPNDILRNKSVLEHTAHRHEPPIVHVMSLSQKRYSFPLDSGSLCEESGEDYLIAINKPASWPVHPTGGYRKNSLVHIMENELGYSFGSGGATSKEASHGEGGGEGRKRGEREGEGERKERTREGGLRMLYRLDRLTSGLILFASSYKSCAAFLKRLQTTDEGTFGKETEEGGIDSKGYTNSLHSNSIIDVHQSSSLSSSSSSSSSSPFLDGVKKMYVVRTVGRFSSDEVSKRFIDDKDVSINGTFSSWSSFRSNYLGMTRDKDSQNTKTLPESDCSILEIFTPKVLRVRHPVCSVPGKRGRFYSGSAARIALQEEDVTHPPPPSREDLIVSSSSSSSSSSTSSSSFTAKSQRVFKKSIGKESATDFVPVAYDLATDTTLAVVIPLTGRTHQIRVHLQGLGHSIVDDPVYGGRDSVIRSDQDTIPRSSAPEALADLKIAEELLRKELEKLVDTHSKSCSISTSSSSTTTVTSTLSLTNSPKTHLWAINNCPVCSKSSMSTSFDSKEIEKEVLDNDDEDLDTDISSMTLPFRKFISLHALSYFLPANLDNTQEHLFRVELPEWWNKSAPDPLEMK